MNQRKNAFTFIGAIFGICSNWASILSYLGLPIAFILAICKKYIWAIVLAVIAFSMLIVIHACMKHRDSIIKFVLRLFAPNSTYCFSKWEVIYEYIATDEMKLHTRYTVKALQTGVDHIRVRFNWSGATETNPIHPIPSLNSGCTTQRIEFAGDEYGYKNYNLYNRTAFNKGDPDVKLGVDIENMKTTGQKEVSHHLLTSVSVVTDTLHMKVILPKSIYPANVVAHEYLHATDNNHWRDRSADCQPIRQDDGTWVISWNIDKPVFGGKYIVYWDPEVAIN